MKKILALTLAALLLLSLVPTAGAASFSDSGEVSLTAKEAVDVMSDLKIITGFPEGTFKPEDTLTRAQAAKILCCVLLGTKEADALAGGGSTFTDVPASHWANKYVEYCASKGIVAGKGSGVFDPNGKLTGYAFGKMLLVALGADASQLTGAGWDKNTAKQMMAKHLEYGVSVSDKDLSRQDACRLALNALFDGEKEGPEGTLANKVFGVIRISTGKVDFNDYARPTVVYSSTNADEYWDGNEKKITASPMHIRQTGAVKGGDVVRIYNVDGFDNLTQYMVYRNGCNGNLKNVGDVFHTGNTKNYSCSGNNVRLEFYCLADIDKYCIIHLCPKAERIASVVAPTLSADGSVSVDGSVTFESGLSAPSNDFTEADVGSYAYYYFTAKNGNTWTNPQTVREVHRGTIVTGTIKAISTKSPNNINIDGKTYSYSFNSSAAGKNYLEGGGAVGDVVHILLTDDGFVTAVWQ